MTPTEQATSLANLELERDAIVLYDSLAAIDRDPRRAAAFRKIASNERRHAGIWADKLEQAGVRVPPSRPIRLRIRLILLLARIFGTRAVADLVRALEGDEEEIYNEQLGPEVASIAADEREHAAIWQRLASSEPIEAPAQIVAPPDAGPTDGAGTTTPGMADAVSAEEAPVAVGESWHRASRSGTLRASVFGVNDGLVSNLSLVMGVIGASATNEVVVLAGLAGLLAGAFSMGAGEWISMTSQRELFERQIELEREELRIMPDEEAAELVRIFRRKGLATDEARRVAQRLMKNPEAALDTLVREELGLDPDELGSPIGAATGSFLSFAAGAFVPLAPFLALRGDLSIWTSLALAFAALFAVGVGVSLLTGRSALRSGLRQVAIGAGAALVTYLVGLAIGVQMGG